MVINPTFPVVTRFPVFAEHSIRELFKGTKTFSVPVRQTTSIFVSPCLKPLMANDDMNTFMQNFALHQRLYLDNKPGKEREDLTRLFTV